MLHSWSYTIMCVNSNGLSTSFYMELGQLPYPHEPLQHCTASVPESQAGSGDLRAWSAWRAWTSRCRKSPRAFETYSTHSHSLWQDERTTHFEVLAQEAQRTFWYSFPHPPYVAFTSATAPCPQASAHVSFPASRCSEQSPEERTENPIYAQQSQHVSTGNRDVQHGGK